MKTLKKVIITAFLMVSLPTPGAAVFCGLGGGGGISMPIGGYADAAGPSAVGAGEFTLCFTPVVFLNVRAAYRIGHTSKHEGFSSAGEYKSLVIWAGPAFRLNYYPLSVYATGYAGISRNSFTYPYLDAEENEHIDTINDFRPVVYGGGGADYRLTAKLALDFSAGVAALFGGRPPKGTKAALSEGPLLTIDFAAMLKYYFM